MDAASRTNTVTMIPLLIFFSGGMEQYRSV